MNKNIGEDEIIHLKSVAAEAGELLCRGFRDTCKTVNSKAGRELVTQYDIDSEELIKERLLTYGLPVIAEESGGSVGHDMFWVIDPLDGTNNFAYGIPHFAVTFALMDMGAPVAGVIYDPLRKEMFSAIKNGGACLNGSKINVSGRTAASDCIAATGFAYDRSEDGYDNIGNISRMAECCRGIRRMGAASLDLAYVASGRFDCYWENGLKMWDMAAGALIVREAGGVVSGLNGGVWNSCGDHILATSGLLHDDFMEMIDTYAD